MQIKEEGSLYRYRTGLIVVFLSAAYLASTIIWVLKEPPVVLVVMEVLTMLSALAIVFYFIILSQQSDVSRHVLGVFGLVLASAMAVVTVANHFIYLTVITPIYGSLTETPVYLRLDGWPSVTKALECVSWAAMLGTAMVTESFALSKSERITAWILRISGASVLLGLIGPFSGNMGFYFFSTAGYTLGFLVLSIYDVLSNRRRTGTKNEKSI